jgi:very-short-patch-repair endonuclease
MVDFFAPRAKWVVEVDGAQHLGADHAQKDRRWDR